MRGGSIMVVMALACMVGSLGAAQAQVPPPSKALKARVLSCSFDIKDKEPLTFNMPESGGSFWDKGTGNREYKIVGENETSLVVAYAAIGEKPPEKKGQAAIWTVLMSKADGKAAISFDYHDLGNALSGVGSCSLKAGSDGFAPTSKAVTDRASYEKNLTACVKRSASCNKTTLSPADLNYVTNDLGSQNLSPQDVKEVVAVRMDGYGKAERVIIGHSSGSRYRSGEGYHRQASSESSSTSSGGSGGYASHSSSAGCTIHVNGYTRSNGTVVRGYDRRNPRC